MVKCTFLGHKAVFEEDLSDKLDAAIAKVVRKNDEAEFLFFDSGSFYNLCLAAVLKAQRRYPKKQIRVILVREPKDNLSLSPIPMCLIDVVLQAPKFPQPKNEHDFTLNHRQTIRWTLDQCEYLISYVYPLADKDEAPYYRYAKSKKLTILDVTEPSTMLYMSECLKARSSRDQTIVNGRIDGRTLKDIGKEVGISSSMVQQDFGAISKSLICSASDRLKRQTENKTIACGVFSMGLMNPQKMAMFRQVVSFLITRYRVREFKVTAEASYSNYMGILEREIEYYPDVRLSIITHYSENTPENWFQERLSAHEAFCDSLENINPSATRTPRAQMCQVIHRIMETTDYCICNLTGTPLSRNIENHACKLGGVRLVNIGKDICEHVSSDERCKIKL